MGLTDPYVFGQNWTKHELIHSSYTVEYNRTCLSKQPSPSTARSVKLCSGPLQQYSSLTPAHSAANLNTRQRRFLSKHCLGKVCSVNECIAKKMAVVKKQGDDRALGCLD
jgi:hypothetical protein